MNDKAYDSEDEIEILARAAAGSPDRAAHPPDHLCRGGRRGVRSASPSSSRSSCSWSARSRWPRG
ncbi:hypothetical protein ACRAWD_24755 [Caulobacter segnis]